MRKRRLFAACLPVLLLIAGHGLSRRASAQAPPDVFLGTWVGVNLDFQRDLDEKGPKVSGTDQNGEPRVLELPEHRFFIVTLFVPGASYVEGSIMIEEAHLDMSGRMSPKKGLPCQPHEPFPTQPNKGLRPASPTTHSTSNPCEFSMRRALIRG